MRLTREDAKSYCKGLTGDYLQSKGYSLHKAFRCLNPAHNDTHASMSYDKNRKKAHCFSCNADYDLFDLIGLDYGLTDDKDIFNKAYELYGIEIEGEQRTGTPAATTAPKEPATDAEPIQPELTAVIEQAHKDLMQNSKALEYLHSRGLTDAIIDQYKIGYSDKGHNSLLQAYPTLQTKSKKEGLYKYVLPVLDTDGRATYFRTEIIDRNQIDEYNPKYRNINGIGQQLFNERYIKADAPAIVFLCEGVYDALSVEIAGGKAIGGIATSYSRILNLCKQYKPDTYFIIALDNDTAGKEAIDRIAQGFNEQGIQYAIKPAANGKDYNEALQTDKEAFITFISKTIEDAEQSRKEAENEAREAYIKSASVVSKLQGFKDSIEASKTASYHPTGFTDLDEILDGGLRAGLYIVGAISSLGKTTFCLQVMDFLAKCGTDAIIFSLEMASYELLAKSISRETMIYDIQQNHTTENAKTTLGILTGKRYANYNSKEIETISKATDAYGEYAKNIYIHEGVGNIGVEQVRDTIAEHIRITGRRPVVLIDYIQILAPYSDRVTDKQNTDHTVLELKRISRDYGIPVIGVSSFNRESYTEPVNMAAFKESGAVEYTSDVLLGLQYEGMDYVKVTKRRQNGESYEALESKDEHAGRVRDLLKEQEEKAKRQQAQQIEIKILKNRNGVRDTAKLDFYPYFNRFTARGIIGEPDSNGFIQVLDTADIPFTGGTEEHITFKK